MFSKFLGGVCLALVGFSFCLSASAVDATFQDWQFPTSATPASPTLASNAVGTASATVVIGFLSSGWLPNMDGFGTQTGLWDLGFQDTDNTTQDTRGKVILDVPNTVNTNAGSFTDLDLRVVQYVDGFLYVGGLSFSLPGVESAGQRVIETTSGPFGGSWVEDHFHWRLAPSPAHISLVVTGDVRGSILDRIKLDTVNHVPAVPLQITSVKKGPQGLAVSWVGGLPPYQIYVATNLNGAPWEMVGAPVSTTNTEISIDAAAKFVKVRGSE